MSAQAVEEAAEAVRVAQARLIDEVRRAHRAGEQVTALARAAGVSRPAIYRWIAKD